MGVGVQVAIYVGAGSIRLVTPFDCFEVEYWAGPIHGSPSWTGLVNPFKSTSRAQPVEQEGRGYPLPSFRAFSSLASWADFDFLAHTHT